MGDDRQGASEPDLSALALHELSNVLLAIQLTASQALTRCGPDAVLSRQLSDILEASEQGAALVQELSSRATEEG